MQKKSLGLNMLAGLVLLALVGSTPMNAQRVRTKAAVGGWQMIGTVEAGFKADHDTIAVRGPFDDFRKIKFKVTGAGLNLQRLVVVYDNGQPDNIEVRENIKEGGESRQIDLAGAGRRSIRRIDFWYDTKGILKGHAKVTVVGMK
jgi:hypothetical protein